MITSRSNGRLRLLKVCFSGFLLLPLSVLLGKNSTHTKDIPEHTLIKIEPFQPMAYSLGLPPVYEEIDSLLEYFYKNIAQYPIKITSSNRIEKVTWDENEISDEFLERIAQSIFHTHFYPESLFSSYCRNSNTSVGYYLHKLNQDRKTGIPRTEITYPLPGYILNTYFCNTLIPSHLSWEYNLLLRYKYILEIEPISKEIKVIDPNVKGFNGIFYSSKVIKDFKGNFNGEGTILVSSVPDYLKGSLREMEVGNRYIVLIWHENTKGAYGLDYMLRGSATKGRGIFKIVDGKIKDDDEVLVPGRNNILVNEFYTHLASFINSNFGATDEKY